MNHTPHVVVLGIAGFHWINCRVFRFHSDHNIILQRYSFRGVEGFNPVSAACFPESAVLVSAEEPASPDDDFEHPTILAASIVIISAAAVMR